MRHQAELQLRGRRDGRRTSTSSSTTRRSAASGSCPRPTRATSGSTSRGTRSTRPRAGSSTSSATATATTPGEVRYEALWARDRDGERAVVRAVRRLARRAPPPVTRAARLPLRRLRAHRADPPHGRARHARARGRRPPPRRGARRPLPHRQAVAPRLDVDSYSIKAIEKLYGFERTAEVTGGDDVDRPLRGPGSRPATSRSSRRSSATTRRTAARPYELHEWLLSIRPRDVPWRDAARAAAAEGGDRRAGRGARGARERLLAGTEEGDAAAAARAPRRLPPARGAAAVVGVVPLAAARRRRADRRPHGDRRARAGTARPPEVEGQSHAYRMTFPPQEHKLRARAFDPDTRSSVPAPGRRRPRRRDAAAAAPARRRSRCRAG